MKECSYLTEKLSRSFYRTFLSKELHPLYKTNQQLVVWGKQSFSGTNPKVILDIKFLGERCFRLVTSVRQRKKSESPCGIRLSVSSLTNSSLSDSKSYLCFMIENTADCLHIYCLILIISSESLVVCQELLIEKLPILYLKKQRRLFTQH